MERNTSIRKVVGFGILCGALLLLACTILSHLSPFFEPDKKPLFAVLGLFYPLIFLANLGLMTLTLVLRSKTLFISILTLLIGLPGIFSYFGINGQPDYLELTDALCISSYNLQFSKPLTFATGQDSLRIKEDFETFLNAHDDIDVLCVQEYGWRSKHHIQKSMDFSTTYHIDDKSVAILSKYPIVNKGIVELNSNTANTCLWADIKVDTDTLRVYTYHLESNRHTGKVPKVIDQESPEKKNVSTMLGIVKYYPPFSHKRLLQVRRIKEHAAHSPYPTVLCGDLNDTPHSRVYKELAQGMDDAFRASQGSGKTLVTRVPLVRIDYIFSNGMELSGYQSLPNEYSDHYMLKAYYEL